MRACEPGTQRAAAVALAISDEGHGADLPGLPRHPEWSAEAALILTRRALALRHHAGQWALPGGRIEPGETAEQAALREMSEEVALVLEPGAVLGRLDDFVTRSGFVITPVVVWAGAARAMTPHVGEVQSIHRIRLREFLRPDAPLLDSLEGSAHPVLRMPVGDSWIAAPTAAILYQFREVCLGARATRVAHFEQPMFAWK
ncbi:MAG: CoA pyrophosphatase [Burkholderiaceae bacterium]